MCARSRNPGPGIDRSHGAVDGLAVGAAVHPESPTYQAYKCHSSEQFSGFTWCAIKHSLSGKMGRYNSWVTILHSDANTAVFILQDIIPAYFAPGDADREIERLSQKFGQEARIYNSDPRPEAPHSVIATWGDVTLTPLDQPTLDALSRGETINAGLVIDFLADSRKSAREGLPVFHIGGGSGYIWAAMFDDSGKGRLRITAVNPSLLPERSVEPTPPTVSTNAPAAPPAVSTPAVPAPSPDPAQAQKERAARVDKAIAAANAQLEDVGGFIKEHPQSPKLLEYIDRIAAVSAAVKANDPDPDEIERKLTELNDSLSHDKDYQQHLAEQAEAQKKREAQYLGDAIRRGEQQRDFILDYVGKNPLADVTPAFAGYVKQLNSALQQADLDQLQPLVDKVDVAIREAGLESAFIAAQKEPPKVSETKADAGAATPSNIEPASSSPAKETPSDTLPTTDKNKFLVEGDLDDVELLYNASSIAPHVAQNLRGDFVFAEHQARVCLFGQNPDELALIVERTTSAKVDPKQVTVSVEPCNPEQLLTYDIVATQRNAFLRSKKEDALALLKFIEDGSYRQFAEVTAGDLKKAADAERAQIEKIKANVSDGAPDGYGVTILKTGSPNLCVAVANKISSHHQLLLRSEEKLSLEMRTGIVIKDTTIDDAFINIHKDQCGAVYASAADLKTLTTALAHNSIPYVFSSLWILPDEVDREDAALDEKEKAALQDETKRAQWNTDQSRRDQIRKHDLDATQTARQAALRDKFGESAQAAAGSLSSEIVAWTKDQNGPVGTFYPAFAAWWADKLADHWEIVTINSGLEDFGTSNFKTRSLDTVFSRLTLHLKNRMLGEYKDFCFIFGRINDTEFSMRREPAYAQCDDEAAIKAWQEGHQFKSEWFASNSAATKSDEMGANAPSPADMTPNRRNDTTEAAAHEIPVEAASQQPPREPNPAEAKLKPPPEPDLPQYKFARSVERSPTADGSAESQYLTIVYGMIKAHLRESPELHLDLANKHGLVDFFVDEGGNLVGRKLVSSSGSQNLDMAVMAAIAEAAPYPAPPHWSPIYLSYSFGKNAKPIDTSTTAAPAPIVPSATAPAPAVGPAQWQKQTNSIPGRLY